MDVDSLPSFLLDSDAAEQLEKQKFVNLEKLREMDKLAEQAAEFARLQAENAAADEPLASEEEAAKLDAIADGVREDLDNHANRARKELREHKLPSGADAARIKEVMGAEPGSNTGAALFCRDALPLSTLMSLRFNKGERSVHLFIPREAVDSSMRIGSFKRNHELGNALHGLFLMLSHITQQDGSILALPSDYGEEHLSEASRELDACASKSRQHANQAPAAGGAAGGGRGGGGAAAKARGGYQPPKSIPYNQYCADLKCYVPHQCAYFETVFAAKKDPAAARNAEAAKAAAAAADVGRYENERKLDAAAEKVAREAELKLVTAMPDTGEVIGWDFVVFSGTHDSDLGRGLSMLCAHITDVVSGRKVSRLTQQEAITRRHVVELVETLKREHLSVDNIHSTVAHWLFTYHHYAAGMQKYSMPELATFLNMNRPADGLSLTTALTEILSIDTSIKLRLSLAFTMFALSPSDRVLKPRDVDAAKCEQAREHIWYPQGLSKTYTSSRSAADIGKELVVTAFNPLPLSTTSVRRLQHYHMPHSNVDESLMSKADREDNDKLRLLYEESNDMHDLNLQIDDSVRAARANWSWTRVEDKLILQSAQESADILNAQVTLNEGRNLLARIKDDDEELMQNAQKAVNVAERELEQTYEARRRSAHQALDEILHSIGDTTNGCTGANRVSAHINNWVAASSQHTYGNRKFRNGCNAYGLLDVGQSWFQNFIHRRMILVDKVFQRVNSHIPFFKAEVVRTAAYDLKLGKLRSCCYLDGESGAGKTDLLNLIYDTTVSADRVQYSTDKALTTEAIDALSCHVMSEITPKFSGLGPDGVDNVMKEALSSGFVSVRTFHQEDKDATRRLRATGALFLVAMIAAGNDPFTSFPPEVRERWFVVYVSSVLAHPEAAAHELKDDSMPRDDEARTRILAEFKDENAWCALAQLVLQTGIGGYRWNLEIATSIINAYNRAAMRKSQHVKLAARNKTRVLDAIKHWSLVSAVHYWTNGPGAIMTGRYKQKFDPTWVFDMLEMATCPTEEIVNFVLSLYADDTLDLRTTSLLARVLPACKAPRPFNMANLSEPNPDAKGAQPEFLRSGTRINYLYQKVNMSIAAGVNEVYMACRDQFTQTEIRHVLVPEARQQGGFRGGFGHGGGGGGGGGSGGASFERHMYVPNQAQFAVHERDANGCYVMKINADTGDSEYSYVKQAAIIVNTGGRDSDPCFYMLTDFHDDLNRTLFLEIMNATCNVFTRKRPYTIATGLPYVDKGASENTWPNAFATRKLEPNTIVPRAYNAYGLDARTYQAVYKNIGETSYLLDTQGRDGRGTSIEGELDLLALKRHLERLYLPKELDTHAMYGYWKWQVEMQTKAANYSRADYPEDTDADAKVWEHLRAEFDLFGPYIDTTDHTLDPPIRDFAQWFASTIHASRRKYQEVLRQDKVSVAAGVVPEDKSLSIWKSASASLTTSIAAVMVVVPQVDANASAEKNMDDIADAKSGKCGGAAKALFALKSLVAAAAVAEGGGGGAAQPVGRHSRLRAMLQQSEDTSAHLLQHELDVKEKIRLAQQAAAARAADRAAQEEAERVARASMEARAREAEQERARAEALRQQQLAQSAASNPATALPSTFNYVTLSQKPTLSPHRRSTTAKDPARKKVARTANSTSGSSEEMESEMSPEQQRLLPPLAPPPQQRQHYRSSSPPPALPSMSGTMNLPQPLPASSELQAGLYRIHSQMHSASGPGPMRISYNPTGGSTAPPFQPLSAPPFQPLSSPPLQPLQRPSSRSTPIPPPSLYQS